MSSGSRGNAIYIESAECRVLIDAGLSERALAARMQAIDRAPADLHAILLTHEHSDHVRGVGPLARKHGLPVFSTAGTFNKIKSTIGHLPDWREFKREDEILLGDLRLEPYPTEHDAEDSVAFVVRQGSLKLGHATDLGHVTPLVRARLKEADALLVESNHDPDMLDFGPYPWPVKQRIKSDLGHLSNQACADLLASVNHGQLKVVVLMHLSQSNNLPQIAEMTASQALKNTTAQMVVARQDIPTPLIEVH